MNHAAGVSQPRVSRALCRSVLVSRETRKRILKHELKATHWGQARSWCGVHRARKNYRAIPTRTQHFTEHGQNLFVQLGKAALGDPI